MHFVEHTFSIGCTIWSKFWFHLNQSNKICFQVVLSHVIGLHPNIGFVPVQFSLPISFPFVVAKVFHKVS
jgi:hypothetical protein